MPRCEASQPTRSRARVWDALYASSFLIGLTLTYMVDAPSSAQSKCSLDADNYIGLWGECKSFALASRVDSDVLAGIFAPKATAFQTRNPRTGSLLL